MQEVRNQESEFRMKFETLKNPVKNISCNHWYNMIVRISIYNSLFFIAVVFGK